MIFVPAATENTIFVVATTYSSGYSLPWPELAFSRRIKGINSYAMSRLKSGIEKNSLSEYFHSEDRKDLKCLCLVWSGLVWSGLIEFPRM